MTVTVADTSYFVKELVKPEVIMSTLKCPRCYGEVDVRAKICPHCRKRFRKTKHYYIASLLGGLGLGVIIIGIFISPTAALITGGLLLLASALVKRAE
jgi:hypothetical protein